MKRDFLFVALFLSVCLKADVWAQASGLVSTQEKAYLAQVEKVSVDASDAVDVASSTTSGSLSGSWAIEVYNVDTSTSAVCAFRTDVTANPDSATAGRPVPASSSVYWAVNNSQEVLYCISSAGTLNLIISQFK